MENKAYQQIHLVIRRYRTKY